MLNKFKQLHKYAMSQDYDLPLILGLLHKYTNNEDHRILDVGCGNAHKMLVLSNCGYQVLGVDINPRIIASNQDRGLNCVCVDEFNQRCQQQRFEVILMSHIIEHFNPLELKNFIDNYLDYLKPSSYLIIATPLLTPNFYDDFDHIRPYTPLAIIQMFNTIAPQIQYQQRHKLHLIDLKFRYRPRQFSLTTPIYIQSWRTKFYKFTQALNHFLYPLAPQLLGQKDGWVGIFRKI